MNRSFPTALSIGAGSLLLSGLVGCGGVIDPAANQRFREQLGQATVTVFPAYVRAGQTPRYDPGVAQRLADFLAQELKTTAHASDAEVPITSQWGMNQARMFRGSCADLANHVRAHPLETDYALLAEYLIGPRGNVIGVHAYLVDAQGTVAYAFLLNSHHQPFAKADPKSVEDCTNLVMQVMREDLK